MPGTYTEDTENGARVACLLINEGTPVVRGLFEQEFHREVVSGSWRAVLSPQNLAGFISATDINDKLHIALNDPAIRSHVDAYTKNKPTQKRGIRKLMTSAQYDLLYPTQAKPDVEEYDLTLLILLMQVLCKLKPPQSTRNWVYTPSTTDQTTAAQLVRLRMLRNRIYGHISQTGLTQAEFTSLWQEIEQVLLALGADANSIACWKTEPISPSQEQEYIEMIQELQSEDIGHIQHISYTVNQGLNQLSSELTNKLTEVKELVAQKPPIDESALINAIAKQLVELMPKPQSRRAPDEDAIMDYTPQKLLQRICEQNEHNERNMRNLQQSLHNMQFLLFLCVLFVSK